MSKIFQGGWGRGDFVVKNREIKNSTLEFSGKILLQKDFFLQKGFLLYSQLWETEIVLYIYKFI